MSYDVDPGLIQSALEQGTTQFEPVLAQLDEWSKNAIMHLLYEWADVKNEQTGNMERVPVKILYPDLYNAAGYALSHLNMIMNYDFNASRSVLLGWRGGYLRPLLVKYRRNDDALTIIQALDSVITRNIMGGSTGGTHQTFLETLVGAIKTLKVGGSE